MKFLSRLRLHPMLLDKATAIVVVSCLGLSATMAQTDGGEDTTVITALVTDVISNGQGVTVQGAGPGVINRAGDVNNDGIDDFIIGSTGFNEIGSNEFTGGAFVIFGGPALVSEINVSELNGSNGFYIYGIETGDSLGSSVESAGDVNGDGIDDIFIGASGVLTDSSGTNAGAIYVIFGRDTFPERVDLTDLDGTNGFCYHQCRIAKWWHRYRRQFRRGLESRRSG